MEKWPSPFWAVLLAAMGTGVSLAVLFHRQDVNISLAVLGIGSNLVSGALGAFAGHASALKGNVTNNKGDDIIDAEQK